MAAKWYMLYRKEMKRTEWLQEVWRYEQLTIRQLKEEIAAGWKVSGNHAGDEIKGPVKPGMVNKNGIGRDIVEKRVCQRSAKKIPAGSSLSDRRRSR